MNNNQVFISAAIFLGSLFQLAISIKWRSNEKKVLRKIRDTKILLIISIVLMFFLTMYFLITGKCIIINNNKDDCSTFISSFLFFMLTLFNILYFSFSWTKEILPNLNRYVFLSTAIVSFYIYLNNFYPKFIIFFYIFFILSLVIIIFSFTKKKFNKTLKLFSYFLYLFFILFLGFFYLRFSYLKSIFIKPVEAFNFFNISETFLTGMTVAFLATNLILLYCMLPIFIYIKYINSDLKKKKMLNNNLRYLPSTNKSFSDDIKEIDRETFVEYAEKIENSFTDDGIYWGKLILIILVEGGVFLLNTLFKLMPDYIIINVFILFMPFFIERVHFKLDNRS